MPGWRQSTDSSLPLCRVRGFARPLLESFLFALALAVGLTPELLPMIVSVTLARGALRMAKARVIVKRLAAIHDLGSMDVLCTDKTGTLTQNRMTIVELRSGDELWRSEQGKHLSDDLASVVRHGILASAREPFDHVQLIGVRCPFAIDPDFFIKSHSVDDQRVPVPLPNRMSIIRRIEIFRMGSAIHINRTKGVRSPDIKDVHST